MSIRCDQTRESGFSLIESLVVLAISSLLLSVLTQMLIFSQDSNQRLNAHFQDAQDARFFDVQMQALIDRVWIDPLYMSGGWQTSAARMDSVTRNIRRTRNTRDDLPFSGTGERLGFTAYDPFTVEGEITRFTLIWVEGTSAGVPTRRLRLASEDYNATWPASFPADARFAYLTLDGEMSETWPPDRDSRWQTDPFLAALGPPPVPRSVHIVRPEQDGRRSLHVFDVRG